MRISKYLHSCLFVEENGMHVLIDPGNYTAQERALDLNTVEKLDYLLITHEHQDHCFIPLLKEVIEKFPETQVISNASVQRVLQQEGIEVSTQGTDDIAMQAIAHEHVLGNEVENSMFHLFDKLSHPGDSLQFTGTKKILALPIQAPWGSMVAAVERAAAVQPKIVIPIHDWHWKDEARQRLYDMATVYLEQKGIEFIKMETNKPIER